MTPTIIILLIGLGLLLIGIGLLGTLLGVRATVASFSNIEIGMIMAGYYVGYVVGTMIAPRLIRSVGHIRAFAAFASVAAATSLTFGLIVHPAVWLALRIVSGLCVVALYMVVESWLNAQSTGPSRGRIFSTYMMSTLVALGAGQFMLLLGDVSQLTLFALAAVAISLGVVPVAVTRVTEPRIEMAVPVGLRQLLAISPLGVAGSFIAGIVSGAFWGMAPVFGQRLNLDEIDIAMLMSTTILGGALLQWPIGHLSDKWDRRTVLILTSVATAAAAAAGGLIVISGGPGLVIASGIYGGLMFALYGISVAHANDHLHHEQVLEATRGLLLIYGVGAFCGPLLSGATMQLVGPVGLPAISAASALLLALFGVYRVTRSAAPLREEQTEYVAMARTTPLALEMHPDADPAPELDLTRPKDGGNRQ